MSAAETSVGKTPILIFNSLSPESRRLANEHEVLMSLEPKVLLKTKRLLQDPNRTWQVSDILPDLEQKTALSSDPIEALLKMRRSATQLSPELLIIQAGNATTEGGLTIFARAIEKVPFAQGTDGIPKTGFQIWGSGWDSEENKHNYGLDRWILLSGVIDVRAFDRVRQKYIKEGFNPGVGFSAYLGDLYPAFQEPATELSHRRTALLAQKQGDNILYELDWKIRGDEARHAEFYGWLGEEIIALDPGGFVNRFAEMMRRGVTMPPARMHDQPEPLPISISSSGEFRNFAALNQAIGIYTAFDYYNIAVALMQRWHVLDLPLSGEAAADQEYLGKTFTPERGLEVDSRMLKSLKRKDSPIVFSWRPNDFIRLDKIQRVDFAR